MSQEEPSNPDVEEWVNELEEDLPLIKALFDRISSEVVSNPEVAREELKELASESKHQDAFLGAYFAIQGIEGFFKDVDTVFGEEKVDELKHFGEQYSHLSDSLKIVYRESYENLSNPVTDQRANAVSLSGIHGTPIITYQAYSGEKKVFSTADFFTNHLNHVAAQLNASLKEAKDYVDAYPNTPEAEQIRHARSHIQDHLDELDELIEEINELEEEEDDEDVPE